MSRPLRLRMRSDLLSSPQAGRRGPVWVIKDPISSRYFRLEDEEYLILRWLDGETSLAELRQRFGERFGGAKLDGGRLTTLLSSFYRSGLVNSDHPGQAQQLYEKFHERILRERWQTWSNVLAIRFRGVNPQPFLDVAYPWCRWMFSRSVLVLGGAIVLLAICVSVSGWGGLARRVPDFGELVSTSNLFWMLLLISMTKVLHELGHAMTCKHFGGECNELGLMLLVFAPCLYCNVSDSWMMANRRHRIAISAAGICMDVFLASLATLLWWATSPGLIHRLAGNVILICGIGAVLINGNPLLRYDGYHILSDMLDMPNLWQQSRERLYRFLQSMLFGKPARSEPFSDRPVTLLIYGLLSVSYKLLVLIAIFAAVHATMRAYGFQIFAEALIFGTVLAMVVGPARRFVKYVSRPTVQGNRWRRLGIVLTLFGVGLVALLLIPIPRQVNCRTVVELGDEQSVYAAVSGKLLESVTAGQFVEQGQVLVRLENSRLRQRAAELTGEIELYRLRLRNLQTQRGQDASLAIAIPTVRNLLEEATQQLADVSRETDRLEIVAPRRGIVLPAKPLPQPEDPQRLLRPRCFPLQPENRGCFVTTGTELCSIGDPNVVDVMLYIADEAAAAVAVGQAARVKLDVYPHVTYRGAVTHIESHQRSGTLNAEEHLPPGWADEHQGWYRARVRLVTGNEIPLAHGHGRARVRVAPLSLATRGWRFLRRNF